MAIENGIQEEGVVKIRSRTRAFSNKKVEKTECPLATFDLPYVTFFYNQKLLLYREVNYEEMVEKLKEGLGVVLEFFYPLTGRLGKDEEGVLRIEKCGDDNGGVEVIEAEAVDISVEELSEDNVSSFMEEIVPFSGILNVQGFHKPLLAVQFTRLKDGLALGCAFNHAVLDGTATWHFLSSWAEICRGADKISVMPFHDRTQARDTRVKLEIPDALISGEAPVSLEPPLPERIFRFSDAAIEAIKTKVNAGRPEGTPPFSSFQCLGTHIWHAVTRARGLKPDEFTVFTIFVDCRKRVSPPMPASYFGNLIQAIFTVTAAGVLLTNPPEFAAGMLQQVITSHDAKAITARSEEWEAAPKLFEFRDAGMNCVAVGSSPRFPVYDVDFGFGRPERVRSGRANKFDGMVYLYPGREGGKSVDVEVCLTADAMEKLEKDSGFVMI
ncbi:BAHD acyltransferase DCR-like [Aristolochia californica]|uniref:BAHD acyltransferase DCR-like n=1 Tax=Aristolochia californica TaxID=171875 RepID=UPI0035D9E0B7